MNEIPAKLDVPGIREWWLGQQERERAYREKRAQRPPSPPREPKQAVPADKWPTWATLVSKMRADSDAGVGDTIRRQLGVLGEAYKATLKAWGVPCGCSRRQLEWNAKYPYVKE